MKIRVTTPVSFIPPTANINVGDQFTTIHPPIPDLFPIQGSVVVTAPKRGGGTVRTWILSGSWEEIP